LQYLFIEILCVKIFGVKRVLGKNKFLDIFNNFLIWFICVTDLDEGSDMIIFELILTTFKLSAVFRFSSGSSVNWLEPKTEPL